MVYWLFFGFIASTYELNTNSIFLLFLVALASLFLSYGAGFYRGQTTALNVVNRDRKELLHDLKEMSKKVNETIDESNKMTHEINVAFGDIRPIGGIEEK